MSSPRFKMQICCVPSCGNSSPGQFFKIKMLSSDTESIDYELEAQRQRDWLKALNIRLQIVQNPKLYRMFEQRMFVCPRHFVSGKPAPLLDLDNVDWVPSINLPKPEPEECQQNGKNYKCPHCPQNYKSMAGVLRHVVLSHSVDEDVQLLEEMDVESCAGPAVTIESNTTLGEIHKNMTCAKCKEIVTSVDEHMIAKHSITKQGVTYDAALSDHSYTSPEKKTARQPKDSAEKIQENDPQVVKRICFKILKVNEKTQFDCEACGMQVENRKEMVEHFKGHLLQNLSSDARNISPVIKETIVTIVKEFQCAVCAIVANSRDVILNCVRRHVESGWPKDNTSGLVWELSGDKDAEGADQDQITLDFSVPQISSDLIYYRCMTCHRYFDNNEDFQKHMVGEHGQDSVIPIDHIVRVEPVVKCSNCASENGDDLTFFDIKQAMDHRKRKHMEVVSTASEKVKRIIINSDESEVVWSGAVEYWTTNCITEHYQCPCKKLYEFKPSALRCLAQHVGIRRFRCQEDHVKLVGKKCWNSFFSAHDLAKHKEKIHNLDNEDCKAICHVCGKLCKRKLLAAHIRQVHRKHKCDQCGKSYEYNYKLKTHIAGVHKRIKKFRCSRCNKGFAWKTGALYCEAKCKMQCNDHRCEYCGKMFARLDEKNSHVADRHPMFSNGCDGPDDMLVDFNIPNFSDIEM